jgi:predicted ATPase/DNA-binding SARP family transcriptional activator
LAVEFRILGPLEVVEEGHSLALAAGKQRAVLAMLLLRSNRVVSIGELIDGLWAKRPPASAAKSVQIYVSQLRKVIGNGALLTRPPGYQLRIAGDELDLARFELLLEEGKSAFDAGRADEAATRLREALSLWRGVPLADFTSEPFAQPEIPRLEELHLNALEARIEADLVLGRHADLIGELEALVVQHPLREGLRGQLMLTLYRSGRQAEALELYQQTRRLLRDELGLEPTRELHDLEQAILRHDPALAAQARFTRAGVTDLPLQPTPLLGRERELREVRDLLRTFRVVTLTGAGGSGKTRLAIQAAADAAELFPDGVWFVSAASLRDARLVEPAIAQALEATGDLHAFLRGKDLLLVLDNLEQLLPEIASTVAALGVSVLATSRERLGVASEREYLVPPLPLPVAQELFVQRARQLVAHFKPDANVAEIVRQLAGMPLAVELAAARVKVLTPSQIVERLGADLGVLATRANDVPPRQRTLKATLDWSHALLSRGERRAFAKLAVFVGGFTIEAGESVANASLDILASLVDKNLVSRAEERFDMLDVIHQYASTRLGASPERDRTRLRHAEYFLGVANSASPSRQWVLKMRSEHGNILAALDYLRVLGFPDLELELAIAASPYWHIAGHHALGRMRLETALQQAPRAAPALQAKGLRQAASLAQDMGDSAGAERLTRERVLIDRSEEQSYGPFIALGIAAEERGDLEEGNALFVTALQKARQANAKIGVATALANLGSNALSRGDRKEAKGCYRKALSLARELGSSEGIAIVQSNLALVALEDGDSKAALQHWHEAFDTSTSIGLTRGLIWTALGVAAVEIKDDAVSATRLLGATDALLTETGYALGHIERRLRADVTHEAQQRLPSESFLEAFAEGRRTGAEKLLTLRFQSSPSLT